MAREQKFALEKGGDKRLVVRWSGIWKNVEIVLDDQVLGEPIPNLKALKAGRDYAMPDGRTLTVKFITGLFEQQGLSLFIDGRPIAGSSQDPREQIKLAAGLLYFVAGLSALLGILGMAGVTFLANLGFGWPSLAAGVVIGVLGYVGAKHRSRAAFGVAAAIILVDMALSIALTADMGGRVPTTGLIIRAFILIAVFRGIKAVGDAAKADDRDLAETFR